MNGVEIPGCGSLHFQQWEEVWEMHRRRMAGDAQEMRGRGVRRHGGTPQLGTPEGGGKGAGKAPEDRERRAGPEPTAALHIWDAQKASIFIQNPSHPGRGRA